MVKLKRRDKKEKLKTCLFKQKIYVNKNFFGIFKNKYYLLFPK